MAAIIIFIALVIGIDIYTYRGVSNIFENTGLPPELFRTTHWIISGIAIIMVLSVMLLRKKYTNPDVFPKLYYITGFIAIVYLPKLIFSGFLLIEDILSIPTYFLKYTTGANGTFNQLVNTIFGNYWISILGISVAIVAMLSIMHSILWGRFNFKSKYIEISSEKIPAEFDGFKILQFSDMHTGSFWGHENKVEKAIKCMKAQKADLIVFTGDMVNHRAEEFRPFSELFASVKAKYGKYAILGNHDYGLYVEWPSNEAKEKNLQRLIDFETKAGFKVLLNQTDTISKEGQSIQLAGVENWGKPPFPQFGDLTKTLENTNPDLFTILLSHDPSHWDVKVAGQSNVDLTLSGHTHGMQLGFNLDSFKWSPVQFKYPKWNGLYRYKGQKLYVNIGLGFIAFPMRVGMHPEMTVFVLRSKQS